MGYTGKLKEKSRAQDLRKRGLSYKEILKHIKVSKSTISLWCRDIKLTKKQLLRLYKKKTKAGLRGCIIGAKRKQEKRIIITNQLLKEGIREVGGLSKRDFFIAGTALYAAEGDKRDGGVAFSNSDPKMVEFMMRWFRTFCQPSEDKFRALLYIHENLNEDKARRYWSKLTKIPLKQFYKSYIPKNRKNRLHKNIHERGVIKVRFSDTSIHRKLKGWIGGIFKNKNGLSAPE